MTKHSQPTIEELPLAELEKITGGRSAGWFPGMGVLGGLAGAASSPFDPGAGPSMDDAFAALGFGVQDAAPVESPVAWHDVAEPPPSFIVGEVPGAQAPAIDESPALDDAAVGIGADDLVAPAADDSDFAAEVEPGEADVSVIGDDGIGELDGLSLEELAIRDDDADDLDGSAADSDFDALLATDDLAAIDDAQLEAAYAAATAELLGEPPMFLAAADDATAPPLHLDDHAVASIDAPMFLDDLDVRDVLAM